MIPAEVVTRTWQRIAQLSPRDASRYVNRMTKEQPAVLAYLLALEGYPFDRHEVEIIFYVGLVVWQIMRQSREGLRQVTIEKMRQAEEANYEFLEQFISRGETGLEAVVRRLLADYPEPEVLRYIVEAIMEEDETDLPIRDEYQGLAFVHLKSVLDAFIQEVHSDSRTTFMAHA